MRLGLIAIILEAVSFLLVTIDLYGSKRILILQERIANVLPKIDALRNKAARYRKSLKEKLETFAFIYTVLAIVLFIIAGPILFMLMLSGDKYSPLGAFLNRIFKTGEADAIKYLKYLGLVEAGIPAAIALSYMVDVFDRFTGFLIRIAFSFITHLLSLIIIALNKWKLEGVMVFIGAILFFISKTLAVVDANLTNSAPNNSFNPTP